MQTACERNPVFEKLGLTENPFGSTPNPRYFFHTQSHAEARASLIVGLECGLGFQALIAPPGMGKTTILFDVLERFHNSARTAFLFQLQGDSRDFLRHLALELEEADPPSDMVQVQNVINRLLINERRKGRRTILIVDEAQSLSSSVLETIRLLSNFESPTEKLLQIVLAGQPQLAAKLAQPELKQLQQRITIVSTLFPLDKEQTQRYIEHRLTVAGYRGKSMFTPEAVASLWSVSNGIPRDINTLCFNALLLLAGTGARQVNTEVLREVFADVERGELTPEKTGSRVSSLPSAAEGRAITTIPDSGLLDFYGFHREPFQATPDSSFLCLTASYRTALGSLYSGILAHEKVLVLIGEPGTGKTHVIACLMELLRTGNIPASYVLARQWPSSSTSLLSPETALRPEYSVAFIDDAHELSYQSLEQIRLLATESTAKAGLQFVLVGIPAVDELLSAKGCATLPSARDHVRLRPLQESELDNYVAARIQDAQSNTELRPVFTTESLEALFIHSEGVPRIVNRVCSVALLKAFSRRERVITADMIHEGDHRAPTSVRAEEKLPSGDHAQENAVLKAAGVLLDAQRALRSARSFAACKPLRRCSK
jgi:general secretion pathway protein A